MSVWCKKSLEKVVTNHKKSFEKVEGIHKKSLEKVSELHIMKLINGFGRSL
jgi:hypothetical protein